ncbi:hypothetical protein [Fimbriiglobus ruber]|uniref:Uncharacterized protein n=1 Tax=Fimbriiglobus ruber TaxID=1908690 RepID=A0A225DAM8_9BACT|nr:hypothetical protein [Fimbriiglobus ruber]OWK38023.1 hypothetical protein FRUB_07143 [Fimbriiglobus ruber]
MTARCPPRRSTFARRLRLAVWAGACAAVVAGGCKSGDKSKDDGSTPKRGDPLFGSRIPPQDLPVPGKDGYGSKQKRDPLLGTPTADDKRNDRAGDTPDATPAGGSASLPPRTSTREVPFRPDRTVTPAALAMGPISTDDSTMSIGDRRPLASTASVPRGAVPLRRTDPPATTPAPSSETAGGMTLNQIAAELRRYGATIESPAREGSQYVVRADVPINPDQSPGLVRRYEGVGASVVAATKQLLDQVRSDKAK